MANQKFKFGQVVMTRAIAEDAGKNEQFSKDILNAFKRYVACDFSDMEYEEDIESNNEAIRTGKDRIFATYKTCKGIIYIITEWDRSYTTVLYPEDY